MGARTCVRKGIRVVFIQFEPAYATTTQGLAKLINTKRKI